MATAPLSPDFPLREVRRYTLILAAVWLALVCVSLAWNVRAMKAASLAKALVQAENSLAKDILARKWNSEHGGVYAPVTAQTPPNPHLANIPERDIRTPSGRRLTLINPAYMNRQLHELQAAEQGVLGHLSSLRPIRPGNAPDPWEKTALEGFERGSAKASAEAVIDGRRYFRLILPLYTEASCRRCHPDYKLGDIRGGLSASIPLAPLEEIDRGRIRDVTLTHAGLGFFGLALIFFGYRRLAVAMGKIRLLGGMLPICASCKKIRDDKGYWQQLESFIRDRSNAVFSHGMCSDCAKKLYPEFYRESD